jgi:hypothetical protein
MSPIRRLIVLFAPALRYLPYCRVQGQFIDGTILAHWRPAG